MALPPSPPMPLIIGSTTSSPAAPATAASKALPPSERISSPARVAYGLAELTIPDVPTAGSVVVFWVGCTAPDDFEELVDSVDSATRASAGAVTSSPAPSSLEATSEVEDQAPQELRTVTIMHTRSILPNMRSTVSRVYPG